MYELRKKLESYLRVNLLGPGPSCYKKLFTGPRSHKGWGNIDLNFKIHRAWSFYNLMGIAVLLLRQDSWRERLRSTYTPRGRKVLSPLLTTQHRPQPQHTPKAVGRTIWQMSRHLPTAHNKHVLRGSLQTPALRYSYRLCLQAQLSTNNYISESSGKQKLTLPSH
jgi:hypothetical protein